MTRMLAILACFSTFCAAKTPEILFLIGEHEYGTAETLPAFARSHLAEHYKARFVHAASNKRKSIDCHRFPGLVPALEQADVLVVSTRRRFPTQAGMRALRSYIAAGKPLVVLRTGSHAFQARASGTGYTVPAGHASWNNFDIEMLGADYRGHYSNQGRPSPVRRTHPASTHPVFRGLAWKQTTVKPHLYKFAHLADDANLLLSAHLPDQPATHQALAWTLTRSNRVFSTSLGGREDFETEWFPTLLKNAIDWALEPNGQHRGAEIHADDPENQLLVPDDLEATLLLRDPLIAQPNFFNFDERGRLWMVQYRQYPEPAGLTALSRDKHWRTTYDTVPHPPGHPDFVPGRDRISIHADTNGDGAFDQHQVWLDGLNLATGLAHDRDGIWVLHPPYLLFYRDPKQAPEVHLRGFGLHDTHSIATALCWGPDGWLYGCHGSTVTSDVSVEGKEGITRSVGQNIWRYHPRERLYEVFAEGGGNIWSCEFDAVGRVYAGANGNSPAFHYVQGGYYAKTFRKHGALSNPHSYGYLGGIEHPGWKRVSCNVFLYEDLTLPKRYHGALFGANPIQGWLTASRLEPDGLNFKGSAIDYPGKGRDRWFRPVVANAGPDGAVYVGDWYDRQVNHVKHQEGQISAADGRLYRITARGTAPLAPFDLSKAGPHELVDLLYSDSKWWRESARRLLRQSGGNSVLPRLRSLLADETGQVALEALWALHGIANEPVDLAAALPHTNPQVRRWAIRLIGDRHAVRDPFLKAHGSMLVDTIRREHHLDVLGQAAATAKRLPAEHAIPLVAALLERPGHPDLEHFIWWAAEAHCAEHADRVVAELAGTRLAPRLVRRLTLERPDLLATLFERVPDKSTLLPAVQKATEGKSLAAIPSTVLRQLAALPKAPLSLRLQLGDPQAIAPALAHLDKASSESETLRIIRVLGERPAEGAGPRLAKLATHKEEAVQLAALQALPTYPSVDMTPLLSLEPDSHAIESALHSLFTSRPAWARAWIESGADIPVEAVARIRQLKHPALTALLPEEQAAGAEAAESKRLRTLLADPGGDPYRGMNLFAQRCGTCHRLFDRGGNIGPDLTAYQRNDLDSLLTAILDPSVEIREGFDSAALTTTDGRTLHGFLIQTTERATTLRSLAGNDVTVAAADIKALVPSKASIMPAGLLAGLEDAAVQDLFSYLRTMQPMNVK